jgi:hypothetical protein
MTETLRTLQPVALSPEQVQQLEKAYERGEVDGTPLVNLTMGSTWRSGLSLICALPHPRLIHHPTFYSEGNRRYAMQLVTNGVCHALLYHSVPDRDPELDNLDAGKTEPSWISGILLEVLTGANLPFLTVTDPSQDEVDDLFMDFCAHNVMAANALGLPEKTLEYYQNRHRDMIYEIFSKAQIAALFSGTHPREIVEAVKAAERDPLPAWWPREN